MNSSVLSSTFVHCTLSQKKTLYCFEAELRLSALENLYSLALDSYTGEHVEDIFYKLF